MADLEPYPITSATTIESDVIRQRLSAEEEAVEGGTPRTWQINAIVVFVELDRTRLAT